MVKNRGTCEKIEEQLKNSKAILNSILEGPENIIAFSLDRNYQYIFFNQAHKQTMKNIWGVDIETGKNMLEYISYPEDKEKAKINFDRALSGENFILIEEYGEESLSRNYWENIYNPVQSGSEIIGLTVFCIDITERIIAEKKLKKSLEEKEMLLKEIHHRVKNNLMVISSLLNLQSQYINDKQALDIFRESQNRAKSMALIHERLYRSTDHKKIDFGEYIHTLANDLFHTYVTDPNRVKLNMDVEDAMVDINTIVPLGLILNELVTNSMKHGFVGDVEGEIKIRFHQEGDEFTLIVGDTGVGFPKDLDFKNTSTLGLQLVTNLTNQLDGNIELNKENGTEFKITFKEQYK